MVAWPKVSDLSKAEHGQDIDCERELLLDSGGGGVQFTSKTSSSVMEEMCISFAMMPDEPNDADMEMNSVDFHMGEGQWRGSVEKCSKLGKLIHFQRELERR